MATLGRMPLSTLLSQALVAYTVEFDNEFEHRMPHRTSTGPAAGSRQGPWLVSLAMWANFMRLVDENGVPLGELQIPARMTNLAGLERWGYIVVAPGPEDRCPKPPRRDWIVRPTARGRQAQGVWRPLAEVIEQRWEERFGVGEIAALRDGLQALVEKLDPDLPHYLPVLGYGMVTRVSRLERPEPGGRVPAADLPLYALLARVLLAYTTDFEQNSKLSLALCASVLRVLTDRGVPRRDLPRLTGISKEAISMSLGFLEKQGVMTTEPDPVENRTKLVRLTESGQRAQAAYRQLVAGIEERWRERFGAEAVDRVRASLEPLVGEPNAGSPLLFAGLKPYPNGWRAQVPVPETLPHYPMVLHRGGFPDGS